MTKTTGFKIRIDAFLPIDKKDFGKQAAAFALIDSIQKTSKVPDDFLGKVTILSVDAKQGGAELPALAGDKTDPATWPLTTDPFPEGATIVDRQGMLDGSVFQNIKLADGTETMRRISADQDAAEQAAANVKDTGKKK